MTEITLKLGEALPADHLGDIVDKYHEFRELRLEMQRQTDAVEAREKELKDFLIETIPKSNNTGVSGKFYNAQIKPKQFVMVPKEKWGVITADDLEKASPQIREGDIVVLNTGWHKYYGDNQTYYGYSPGFYKEAGEWFAAKKVKMVCTDTQALDHPLATAMGPHGPARPHGLLPHVCAEYKANTGRDVLEDFPEWEPCHNAILAAGICGIENVGGDIDKITGKRCTFMAFPLRWKGGDGSMIRLVAVLDPSGSYRIETGQ